MLFSSYNFLVFFLPLTLIFFSRINKNPMKITALVSASFVFYAYHNPYNLLLMISSIAFNFSIGKIVHKNKKILLMGILVNLVAIIYFKYGYFIIENLNRTLLCEFLFEKKELPLGISFFTFQQIAYIVDAYRGGIVEKAISRYALLVSFFPHSIAGPLVQYKEIAPQFNKIKVSSQSLLIGSLIFIIGLFKKVVIADSLAPCVSIVFDSYLSKGMSASFAESWFASICYALQLYFDFSGYSDMALGLARMFNVKFPINFDSPYKATSIIDFWRRWHITLSLFLKNYLYIPLGGNRFGTIQKNINLLLTMLLGGLWHGANWTFVLWGGMHGLFLIINHQYISFKEKFNIKSNNSSPFIVGVSRIVTLIFIIIAWVMFRADSIDSAIIMYKSMFCIDTPSFPALLENYFPKWMPIKYNGFFENNLFYYKEFIYYIILGSFICFSCPNVEKFFKLKNDPLSATLKQTYFFKMFKFKEGALDLEFRQNAFYAAIFSILSFVILIFMLSHTENVFLYFEF